MPSNDPDGQSQVLQKQLKFEWKNVLIVATLLAGLIILLLLNYLSVLPLSKNYPGVFGWLPHGTTGETTAPAPPSAGYFIPAKEAKKKLTLTCPVPQVFCSGARVVSDGTQFYGLGFILPQGTPVYAILGGSISDQPKVEGRSPSQPLLYLKDPENNEVMYSYYGTVSVPLASGTLEKGQEIGKIGPGTFPSYPPFNDLTFVFGIKDSSGKYIKLTADDFE